MRRTMEAAWGGQACRGAAETDLPRHQRAGHRQQAVHHSEKLYQLQWPDKGHRHGKVLTRSPLKKLLEATKTIAPLNWLPSACLQRALAPVRQKATLVAQGFLPGVLQWMGNGAGGKNGYTNPFP